MNFSLLKSNIKSNWVIFAFIAFMLTIYTTVSVGMFNPENAELMEGLMTMLPEQMVKAFGFSDLGTELTTYLAGYLYGFIMFVFPIIYIVITANSLLAGHVDKGTMAYILSTPNKRNRIVITQIIYFILAISVLITYATMVVIIMSAIMWPGHLDYIGYIFLNIVTIVILTSIGSVCFLASAFFNDSKKSVGAGAGLAMFFVMINMLSGVSEDLDFLKNLTPVSLLDANRILEDFSYGLTVSGMLIIILSVIFFISIKVFEKKNLPI